MCGVPGSRLAYSVWVAVAWPAPVWLGLAGGDLASHVGGLSARGPGRPTPVGERLLLIQTFPLHQGALGPLDQPPRIQGNLELLRQGPGQLGLGGCLEQAGHHPA